MNSDDQTTNNNESNEIDFEEKYLRAKADLENYRKQAERMKGDLAKFANENCLVVLLPILDNFHRAATHLPEDLESNEWVAGITGIEKQFEQSLENLGLRKIEVKIGEACDATKHEVVTAGEGENGTVLEILEEGYELNGKILRATKVKVGQ